MSTLANPLRPRSALLSLPCLQASSPRCGRASKAGRILKGLPRGVGFLAARRLAIPDKAPPWDDAPLPPRQLRTKPWPPGPGHRCRPLTARSTRSRMRPPVWQPPLRRMQMAPMAPATWRTSVCRCNHWMSSRAPLARRVGRRTGAPSGAWPDKPDSPPSADPRPAVTPTAPCRRRDAARVRQAAARPLRVRGQGGTQHRDNDESGRNLPGHALLDASATLRLPPRPASPPLPAPTTPPGLRRTRSPTPPPTPRRPPASTALLGLPPTPCPGTALVTTAFCPTPPWNPVPTPSATLRLAPLPAPAPTP